MSSFSRRVATIALAAVGVLTCCRAQAVVVRYETNLGDIDVRLFHTATPLSVANFLNYVDDGDYDGSFIHRSVPDFVIQGGGYRWLDGGNVEAVPSDPPVQNEFGLSNLRGTLAYAKLGGDPNSATNGWFFNLVDNSANLDNQNGGFTVFGRVVGDGMEVVDLIASQQIVNAGSPYSDLPVRESFVHPTIERTDLVVVNSVKALDIPDGDYNFDGTVNIADLSVWESTVGSTSMVEADGNGDGVVNQADYLIWQQASEVPEPSGLVLMFAVGLAATSLRLRGRRRSPTE